VQCRLAEVPVPSNIETFAGPIPAGQYSAAQDLTRHRCVRCCGGSAAAPAAGKVDCRHRGRRAARVPHRFGAAAGDASAGAVQGAIDAHPEIPIPAERMCNAALLATGAETVSGTTRSDPHPGLRTSTNGASRPANTPPRTRPWGL